MPIHSKSRLFLFLFLFGGALGGPTLPIAHADTGPALLNVELEITEGAARDTPEALTATLGMVGEHGCASVETHRGKITYEMEVCREGGEPTAPVLRVNLSRHENSPQQPNMKKLKVTGQLHAGQRTVLGRLHYSDGVETQLTASLR